MNKLLARVLSFALVAAVGCSDDTADLFNCYLAPDVPPVMVRGKSATAAADKCEEEQGQQCTCTAVRTDGLVPGGGPAPEPSAHAPRAFCRYFAFELGREEVGVCHFFQHVCRLC